MCFFFFYISYILFNGLFFSQEKQNKEIAADATNMFDEDLQAVGLYSSALVIYAYKIVLYNRKLAVGCIFQISKSTLTVESDPSLVI